MTGCVACIYVRALHHNSMYFYVAAVMTKTDFPMAKKVILNFK